GDAVRLHPQVALEMAPWYRAADAVLLTSRYEGVPYAAFESLAMQTPFVGPALDGVRELVDGTCGRLVERREDPDAYAEALAVLVVDHASSDPWSVEVTRAAAAERGLEFVALEDHGGPGPARNAAIARTRGELVLPVDADNVLLPGAVGRLVEQLLAAPDDVGFVYPRKLYRGRAPELPLPDYNLYELALGNFCDTGGLWDRRCFDPGPGFPPDGSLPHEDWHLALRLGLAGVRGEPAREPTLLLRRQGFTRSQRSELDRERYERLRASFPELYAPEALAEVKREWAPAVSVVAPVPGGALAAQSCRDLEPVEPGEEARGGI